MVNSLTTYLIEELALHADAYVVHGECHLSASSAAEFSSILLCGLIIPRPRPLHLRDLRFDAGPGDQGPMPPPR